MQRRSRARGSGQTTPATGSPSPDVRRHGAAATADKEQQPGVAGSLGAARLAATLALGCAVWLAQLLLARDVLGAPVLALFGLVTASYVLRRWPLLLHAPKPLHPAWSAVHTIAHRGGRQATPENTLAGFRRCCEGRLVHAVELDVWLTQDGEVAVFHDGTLKRTCGRDGHVNDVRSDALPEVLQRSSDGFRQGEGQPPIPASERRLPLLRDVLALLTSHAPITVMVEFKSPEPELVDSVLVLLQEHEMLHRAACFSLDPTINAQLRAVPEFFLCSEVTKIVTILLLYYCGLVGFLPTSFFDEIFGITAVVVENGNLGFLHRIPVVRSLPLSAQWVLARQVGNVTNVPKLFTHLRERNIVTWCLGVNNDDKLSRARAMGVDAVLTDAPEWIALQTASAGAHRF
jgi:glycerophosphoryl diester phosphodiesterase